MALVGRSLAPEVARRRSPIERCLLVGSAQATRALLDGLTDTRRVKAEVVDRLPLDGAGRPHDDVMRELEEPPCAVRK